MDPRFVFKDIKEDGNNQLKIPKSNKPDRGSLSAKTEFYSTNLFNSNVASN